MSGLRAIELNLVDDLTGMSSGYVLDFSNRTFAEFFETEVGINIYDDAYAHDNSGSKGKRLRRFLQIAQPAAIVRALEAIWEYREVGRISKGEPETVTEAYARLNSVVRRLGGNDLVHYDSETRNTNETAEKQKATPQVSFKETQARFMQINSYTPQKRGYAFESFLNDLFECWGLQPRSPFKIVGEQIDGSFMYEGATFLLEAKWENSKTNAAALHAFQGKVQSRTTWARGLFVSYAGFSAEAVKSFPAQSIVLMDGADLWDMLERQIPFPDVLAEKMRVAAERKAVFKSVRDIFA